MKIEMRLSDVPFVFGNTLPELRLTPEAIPDLLVRARERTIGAADIPMESIFAVLERVSAIWSNPENDLYRFALAELPSRTSFSPAMIKEGLAVVSAICNPVNIRRRLSGDLGEGGADLLDGWVNLPSLGYDLRARPRAPIIHLAAGNVFVGAVDSLVAGIITKNVNILKMSHIDTLFPVLFLESLRRSDPDNIIWTRQALTSWKGGDAAVEAPLLKSDLTILFWGGQEALASVKSHIGEKTRLIENGPRYSFAITELSALTPEPDSVAVRGLALDLSRWDQQACSSPHVVYVIGKDDEPVYRLMRRLSTELTALAEELPRGELSFDEKVEIRRLRELSTMGQAFGEATLICPENFDYTLVFERTPLFRVSCLNRTLFFKRVANIEELIAQIVPISAFLQTVGLNVSNETRPIIERGLLEAGVRRLTDWGGMSEGRDGAPHEGSFLLSSLVEWVDRESCQPSPISGNIIANPPVEHTATGTGPGEFKQTILEDRLDRLFSVLHKSQYYAPLIAASSGHGLKRLEKMPFLDRETFYQQSPPASEAILTGPLTDAYVYASGGTTGEPKFTFYRNDEYRTATNELGYIYRAAGIIPSDVVGNLFLAGNLWTSFNVAGRALENIGCLNLPIGGASDMGNVINYLRIFKATAVIGLPSVIVQLAEEVKRLGRPLQIEKILYGGEHLRAPTVRFLEEALGCSHVRSAGYACVDTGPIGFQCTHLQGTVHHVLTSYQHIELIDTETFQPISNSGQFGEIVATNLDRQLMPIIRYRTGDLGRWTKETTCSCGFSGPSFELLGRCDDLLVIGGINLLPGDVASGLAEFQVSPNFQLVARFHDGKEQLLIRVESEETIDKECVSAALSSGSYKLKEALRMGLVIALEVVPPGNLPRNTRTGKLRVVIDERS
ncbi:MAG: hypothetical protein HQM09_11470 [Candidatus Riflebacteria bacterium]|nr:hypothetical protein [Candidatus Riflebacteria bacterium]